MLAKNVLVAGVITVSVLAYSSIVSVADERSSSTDRERLEARQVADFSSQLVYGCI